jgi:integrase
LPHAVCPDRAHRAITERVQPRARHAGSDPLTGKALYLRATVKTAEQEQAELGRLLDQAAIGRQPERDVTVGQLPGQFMQTAELDVSTRESYEGYIRRTIVPAFGGKHRHGAAQAR